MTIYIKYCRINKRTYLRIGEKQVKNRVEAITDGIVAIAATIMVLELGVPVSNDLMG
jgi:uncharacterized membrane protein